jgi:hypothetical protein
MSKRKSTAAARAESQLRVVGDESPELLAEKRRKITEQWMKSEIEREEAEKVATAATVRRFENDPEIVGSNTLIGPVLEDTLENCACVAAFLWHYQGLDQPTEMISRAQSGLSLITEMLYDALTRQLDALHSEVSHG